MESRVLATVGNAALVAAYLGIWNSGNLARSAAEDIPKAGLYMIETVAGGGPVGDGRPAVQARLSLPGGVAISPDGELIIVDFGNHRVRRVDRQGTIATFAGTGEPGYSGDGGPATRARLARPENAAFGPDGGLYFVDTHNHCIRKIDARDGTISTVAGNGIAGFRGDGGPASGAQFYQPEGIAFDGAGNCYIGDTLNGRIRRIDSRTGIITTIAGTGEIGVSQDGVAGSAARFMRLARLAADADGDVYIADSPSQTLQVWNHTTGIIRTLAGTGEVGFSGDGGPALSARLSYPEGIALDSHKNVYFADLGNHRVRRIDTATGIVTTVAGSGRPGFCGDGGSALTACLWSPGRVAVDRSSNIYVADILNARVRRIDARTGVISTVAGSGDLGDGGQAKDALLAIPGDLAFAPGRLFIAEFGNRRVRMVDLATGLISTVAGGGVRKAENIPAIEASLGLPEGIAVHGSDLYIADSLANRIWRVDLASGVIYRLAGSGEAGYEGDEGLPMHAMLRNPGGLGMAADGTLYFSDFGNNCIRSISPDGRTIHSTRGPVQDREEFHQPVSGLFIYGSHMWWTVPGTPDIRSYDLATRTLRRVRPLLPQADTGEEGLLADLWATDDFIFAANTIRHRILRINAASGSVEVIAGTGRQGFSGDGGPARAASLFRPGAVAGGSHGEIYVADTFNHRVRVLKPEESSQK